MSRNHSRQLTVSQPGRRTPSFDQLTCTADFARPGRWRIAGADGKPPRAATRYERARAASLAVRNVIRAAHTAPAATPADHHTGAPHGVDHPGRDAALTPAQRAAAVRAAAVHTQQQAAMPEEYLEDRTTDPATCMRTPAGLERLAAITRAADACRRALEDWELLAPAADPVDPRRQEHEHPQPGPGRGIQP
ncbi:hypothetical protein [Streptomyces sp. H51]|uniref:hypothetical protein n=1 Tax=Streptomyces sp. H51 TaxID=3111770 RepID=UPI002D790F77|nr:hypothetical protein [Streptomyces sp. H51]